MEKLQVNNSEGGHTKRTRPPVLDGSDWVWFKMKKMEMMTFGLEMQTFSNKRIEACSFLLNYSFIFY